MIQTHKTFIAKQQILSALTIDQVKELINKSMDNKIAIAKYGTDEHRDLLLHETYWPILQNIAKFGNDNHRDFLKNSINSKVAENVFIYGNKNIRYYMINRKSQYDANVYCAMAQYGTDEDRTQLLTNKHAEVRANVALFGNDYHRLILKNDNDEYVRDYVNNRIAKLTTSMYLIDYKFEEERTHEDQGILPGFLIGL